MLEINNYVDENNHEAASRLALSIIETLSIANENEQRPMPRETLANQLDLISELIKSMQKEFRQET